jgi:hypothetical protein
VKRGTERRNIKIEERKDELRGGRRKIKIEK